MSLCIEPKTLPTTSLQQTRDALRGEQLMTKSRRRWIKRRSSAALVVAATSMLIGQKVYEYSAEPAGEKNCPPLVASAPLGTTVNVVPPSIPGLAAPLHVLASSVDARLAVDRTFRHTAAPSPPASELPWAQKGGTINDASCLNQTPVYGIVQVTSVEDIRNALHFARSNQLKVSIAGVRHSMGGHAFFKNALVLDMTNFNSMVLDEQSKVLTVQSGATWHAIQNLLHPTYAVKAMQSTDIFTVGGSISVNAHGMDHQAGSVGDRKSVV